MTAITQVVVQISGFAGVEADSLQFAFDILKRDTVAATAVLTIEKVPILMRCQHCDKDYTVSDEYDLRCPTCESLDGYMKQGREMIIKTITGEQDAQ